MALRERIWRVVCSYKCAEAKGETGMSPSPYRGGRARYKLLKKGSLCVFQS